MTQNKKAHIISFKELGDSRGKLVAIEGGKDIPFKIARVFYIYGSDNEVIRAKHANRRSEFILVNVRGTSKVKVDYGDSKEVFELNKPYTALFIPRMIWKEMYNFSEDSVLLVLSNYGYDPEEYVSDYDKYLSLINEE